jgi:hypothetical protein
MKNYSIEEWSYLTIDERVEACFKHYYLALEEMRNGKEEVDMNDYTSVRAILATLANIRGHHGTIC